MCHHNFQSEIFPLQLSFSIHSTWHGELQVNGCHVRGIFIRLFLICLTVSPKLSAYVTAQVTDPTWVCASLDHWPVVGHRRTKQQHVCSSEGIWRLKNRHVIWAELHWQILRMVYDYRRWRGVCVRPFFSGKFFLTRIGGLGKPDVVHCTDCKTHWGNVIVIMWSWFWAIKTWHWFDLVFVWHEFRCQKYILLERRRPRLRWRSRRRRLYVTQRAGEGHFWVNVQLPRTNMFVQVDLT